MKEHNVKVIWSYDIQIKMASLSDNLIALISKKQMVFKAINMT
jgi:hypothetical protein